jgi:hypothetical protein
VVQFESPVAGGQKDGEPGVGVLDHDQVRRIVVVPVRDYEIVSGRSGGKRLLRRN